MNESTSKKTGECEHLIEGHSQHWHVSRGAYKQGCKKCQEKEKKNLWICCLCSIVLCGRETGLHMESHFKENPKHCVALNMEDFSFWCYSCDSYVYDESLFNFYSEAHLQKFGFFPCGYGLIHEKNNESELIQEVKTMLQFCTPITESVDMISKRVGMPTLQKVLKNDFGRLTKKQDDHGVYNYTIKENVLTFNTKDGFVKLFKENKIKVEILKKEANSFRLYYVKDLCVPEEIISNFKDKKRGRTWQNIFNKHFYITISPTTILYNNVGLPVEQGKMITKKEIFLVTPVGFDLSANRLTGVHYGDFLRYLRRKDGESVEKMDETKKNKIKSFFSSSKKIDHTKTELWNDSYGYWMTLDRKPTKKYILKEELLLKDYELMFSLMFTCMQKHGIEVPVVVGIGCGVFGKCYYPEYHKVVAQAYKNVLTEKDYGFKCVLFCDINIHNIKAYKEVLFPEEQKIEEGGKSCKVPIIITKFDILVVARVMAEKYVTCIMNAGDLWEFGQFFEHGGALEEYIARMTTSYFSQHYLLNPNVVNDKFYRPIDIKELISEDKDLEHFKELIEFVKNIKTQYNAQKPFKMK